MLHFSKEFWSFNFGESYGEDFLFGKHLNISLLFIICYIWISTFSFSNFIVINIKWSNSMFIKGKHVNTHRSWYFPYVWSISTFFFSSLSIFFVHLILLYSFAWRHLQTLVNRQGNSAYICTYKSRFLRMHLHENCIYLYTLQIHTRAKVIIF